MLSHTRWIVEDTGLQRKLNPLCVERKRCVFQRWSPVCSLSHPRRCQRCNSSRASTCRAWRWRRGWGQGTFSFRSTALMCVGRVTTRLWTWSNKRTTRSPSRWSPSTPAVSPPVPCPRGECEVCLYDFTHCFRSDFEQNERGRGRNEWSSLEKYRLLHSSLSSAGWIVRQKFWHILQCYLQRFVIRNQIHKVLHLKQSLKVY